MFGGDITIQHRQQLVSIDNFIIFRVSQTLAPPPVLSISLQSSSYVQTISLCTAEGSQEKSL